MGFQRSISSYNHFDSGSDNVVNDGFETIAGGIIDPDQNGAKPLGRPRVAKPALDHDLLQAQATQPVGMTVGEGFGIGRDFGIRGATPS